MTAHLEPGIMAELTDGTLPPDQAAEARGHLAECRSCMAAYTDAVRYRAAWLAQPDGFGIDSRLRRVALDPAATWHAASPRVPHVVRRVSLLAAAAAVAVWIGATLVPRPSPTLGFALPPHIREASEASSARGLVLPGAEGHVNDPSPEQRAGRPTPSPELEREVRSVLDAYENGSQDADASATVVAALLAMGEIDAARDYAREGLRRHPDNVPLLVFAADARYRSNDLAGAEGLLRRARARAPSDPVVALDLALVLRQSGRERDARDLLSRLTSARMAPLAARAKRELARPALR